jgi:hypothetical protein
VQRRGHVAYGQYVAETDHYSRQSGKLSLNWNAIVANGKGQVPMGRSEGDVGLQPTPVDMSATERIVAQDAALISDVNRQAGGDMFEAGILHGKRVGGCDVVMDAKAVLPTTVPAVKN